MKKSSWIAILIWALLAGFLVYRCMPTEQDRAERAQEEAKRAQEEAAQGRQVYQSCREKAPAERARANLAEARGKGLIVDFEEISVGGRPGYRIVVDAVVWNRENQATRRGIALMAFCAAVNASGQGSVHVYDLAQNRVAHVLDGHYSE